VLDRPLTGTNRQQAANTISIALDPDDDVPRSLVAGDDGLGGSRADLFGEPGSLRAGFRRGVVDEEVTVGGVGGRRTLAQNTREQKEERASCHADEAMLLANVRWLSACARAFTRRAAARSPFHPKFEHDLARLEREGQVSACANSGIRTRFLSFRPIVVTVRPSSVM
jgi:hypothetical protein